MRARRALACMLAPLALAGCAGGAGPVSNIIIGGGMQHCSTTQTTIDQHDRRCGASWRAILKADPAFAGMREEQVQFGPVALPALRYAASPDALRAFAQMPERLVSQAARARVHAMLAAAPGPWDAAQFSSWMAAGGAFTPGEQAALRHVFALPTDAPERRRQLRSVAFSTDQDTVAIYRAFVEAASAAAGGGKPTIGVVTASADDPFNDHDIYVSALRSAGATVVWLPFDGGLRRALDANDCAHLPIDYSSYAQVGTVARAFHSDRLFPDLAAQQVRACENNAAALNRTLASLHGVFFTGGNQARHRDSLMSGALPSPQLEILRRRFAAGQLVVAGSSAGNAVQAGGTWQGRPVPMIAGGDPVASLLRGYTLADAPQVELPGEGGTYQRQGGLGFFSFGPLDSHFSERAREGRLVRLAADTAMEYAFGVDENTALVVGRADAPGVTRMSVVGAHGVWVADLRAATRTSAQGAPFAIEGVRVHYLHQGDTLAIDRAGALTVTLAARADAAGARIPAGAPRSGLRLARLASELAASGSGQASGTLGACPAGALMTLRRLPSARLAASARAQLSYTGLALSIGPCAAAPSLAMEQAMPHNWSAAIPAQHSD